jgi:hypothetical protein
VAIEPKLAQDRIEEATPLGVVAILEIESCGDMVTDVDDLNNRGGDRRGGIEISIEGVIGVIGGGGHGCGGGCCGSLGGEGVQESFAGRSDTMKEEDWINCETVLMCGV